MAKERLALNDALICAGTLVSTEEYRVALRRAHDAASEANRIIQDIEVSDVYEFGGAEKLNRLKRNADALSTLSGMCADAADYMKEEIHALFKLQEAYDKEQQRKHAVALQRDAERTRKRGHNEKARSKQKAEAE